MSSQHRAASQPSSFAGTSQCSHVGWPPGQRDLNLPERERHAEVRKGLEHWHTGRRFRKLTLLSPECRRLRGTLSIIS